MDKRVLWCTVIIFLVENLTKVLGNLQMDISKKLKEENNIVLSRKRRYLVFPEGSSFQVVFDLTYPSVGMGNAFVFGHTAAMGFELPSTPIFLDKKKMTQQEDEKSENKTMEKVPEHLEHPEQYQQDSLPPLALDHKQTDYQESTEWQYNSDFAPDIDSNYDLSWSNIDRSPVTFYSNPFQSYIKQNSQQKLTPVNNGHSTYIGNFYRNPYNFWNERNFQNTRNQDSLRFPAISFRNNMAPFRKTIVHHIHRRSRREIYAKIEKLFTALSKDGKDCILKVICQVNRIPRNKGSMWEEIIKAIFRVKPDDLYPDQDHYDRAANSFHDCDQMYPQCDGHVLSKIFRKKD